MKEDYSAEELIQYFNNTYGIEKEWPKQFEVSAYTYGKCCQTILERLWDERDIQWLANGGRTVEVFLGPNKGLMLRNVELHIKKGTQCVLGHWTRRDNCPACQVLAKEENE